MSVSEPDEDLKIEPGDIRKIRYLLKGVFAKNKREYRLTAKNNRF